MIAYAVGIFNDEDTLYWSINGTLERNLLLAKLYTKEMMLNQKLPEGINWLPVFLTHDLIGEDND